MQFLAEGSGTLPLWRPRQRLLCQSCACRGAATTVMRERTRVMSVDLASPDDVRDRPHPRGFDARKPGRQNPGRHLICVRDHAGHGGRMRSPTGDLHAHSGRARKSIRRMQTFAIVGPAPRSGRGGGTLHSARRRRAWRIAGPICFGGSARSTIRFRSSGRPKSPTRCRSPFHTRRRIARDGEASTYLNAGAGGGCSIPERAWFERFNRNSRVGLAARTMP